jgi:hypothetical protein
MMKMKTAKESKLTGLAQIHVCLYAATTMSEATIVADLCRHTHLSAGEVEAALSTFNSIDSRVLWGDEKHFVSLHRLLDVYAVRYVRSEATEAHGWSQWPIELKDTCLSDASPALGSASLLQCEIQDPTLENALLQPALEAALQQYPGFRQVTSFGCAVLPFGLLCELDQDRPTWLLVNKPNDSKAAQWMTAD